jgi:apolipoprotein N-acyltransferase
VLLALANPPTSLWPLALVALVPLLLALRSARPLSGGLIGLTFGFAYFGLVMYWILLFGELAWSGLALANASFAALFGSLAPVMLRRGRPWVSALSISCLWTSVEFLRSLGPLSGLTWGDLAYTQSSNRMLLPLAALAGGWAISFAVVLVNALLAEAASSESPHVAPRALALAGAVAIVPVILPLPHADGRAIDVAAIQVEVPKTLLLSPDLEDRLIAERHASLHRDLAEDPPDLVVWAEDSLDTDPANDPALRELVQGTIREVGAPTLVGGIMGPDGGRKYNQGVLYDGGGAETGRYAKTNLVPFGEYVPWRDRLSFLELLQQVPRDLTPGKSVQPIAVENLRFGDIICFENGFPPLVRAQVTQGAQFIVVSSNNASYLTTAASQQQLEMSRLRAVENGRWVIHAGVSGISAFIDPAGGVHQATELFRQGITRQQIRTSDSRTPYNRTGDWVAFLSMITAAGMILMPNTNGGGAPPGPLPAHRRVLVILPTYNEAQTIGSVLSQLLALPQNLNLLVIDDGSPDGTAGIVQGIAKDEPRVNLHRRAGKFGLASAYAEGFERALEGGYDLAVEMDSDLSHDPAELPRLLQAASDHHLVVGSRYIPGGSVTNWSYLRRLLSRTGNRYARFCLGFPFTDSTSGFRVYRRDLLEHLMAKGVHAEGYGFQVELAFRSWKDGFAVVERPITFREREHGHSKISRRIVVEALWEVTIWGARDRFRPR